MLSFQKDSDLLPSRFLPAAGYIVRTCIELAEATRAVVACRLGLGVSALVNPATADHAEFARMMPEKVKAFVDAGAALFGQSSGIARQMTRFAGNETTLAMDAALTMRVVATSGSLASEQARYAIAWFGRAISQAVTLGTMMLQAQAAAMAPVHRAATDNARRLTG